MRTREDFLEAARTVNHEIKEQQNRKSIRYHWHEADVTVLEGVLARGDRRIGAVIANAYRNGALYDAWTDEFSAEIWERAFAQAGVDPAFYTTRERDVDEILPWDFIDIGVTKKFLKKEWQLAQMGRVTPNCRQSCSGCGAVCYGGGVCVENKN